VKYFYYYDLFVHFLFARNQCYFLCLETNKVTKENSRLQIILGLLFFRLPTQYNSSSFVLLKQYCLQQAFAAIFKTFASSQNSLRPVEIQETFMILLNLASVSSLHFRFACAPLKIETRNIFFHFQICNLNFELIHPCSLAPP